MANPTAFGRATRVRHTVDQLKAHLKIQEQWPVEGAAMLSQIGCIALPAATLDKLYKGEVPDDSEREMVKRMPTAAEKCLAHIRRIDSVRKILQQHNRHFAEGKKRSDADLDDEIPWGARAKNCAGF
jgi:response regulator RpfG family c-di-GMP phosphodiesterase